MHFADAIRQLNDGTLLARPHWPRGCYIGLTIALVSGAPRAYLVARSGAGEKAPWIGERHDIEADDWDAARP